MSIIATIFLTVLLIFDSSISYRIVVKISTTIKMYLLLWFGLERKMYILLCNEGILYLVNFFGYNPYIVCCIFNI